MAKLILIRHGQSLWNAQNRFTGWVDVPLSERGRAEATIASCQLREKHYQVDVCFTSLLIRAIETAIICSSMVSLYLASQLKTQSNCLGTSLA